MFMVDLKNEITRRVWRFHRTDGSEICWLLQLAPNGTIVNYSCPSETFWALDGDDILFLDEQRVPTTRFSFRDFADDRLGFSGRYLPAPGQPEIHQLTSWRAFDPALDPARGFHMRANISGRPRLVVTLNGRGRCFEGSEHHTEFEMRSLGSRVDADTIAVAERDTRACWYGDKIDALVQRIAPIARVYAAVTVTGMSSGGFGSLLLSEALGAALPATSRVCSVVVNPQTSLLGPDTDEVYALAQWSQPPVIAPDARAAIPAQYLSAAATVASMRGSSVAHTVIYDSGNPAETHHAMKMRDVPRCSFSGHDLGKHHAESCAALYQSGVVAATIAGELDRLSASAPDHATRKASRQSLSDRLRQAYLPRPTRDFSLQQG